MIKELKAAQMSIRAHPDFGPDTEFEGTFSRIGEVIESLELSPIQSILAALEDDEPKPVRIGFKERLEKALKEQKQLQCLHASGDSVPDKDGLEVCPDCGKYGGDC